MKSKTKFIQLAFNFLLGFCKKANFARTQNLPFCKGSGVMARQPLTSLFNYYEVLRCQGCGRRADVTLSYSLQARRTQVRLRVSVPLLRDTTGVEAGTLPSQWRKLIFKDFKGPP